MKSPISTLRGHNVAATALAYCHLENVPYLLSGDEEGNIIVWDLSIFRKAAKFSKISESRVQSLRVIRLCDEVVIVAQSRNHGIRLLHLEPTTLNQPEPQPKVLASYSTYDSLFSRGDAKTIDNERALLAFPSCIENYLVTVRLIGPDAQTQISGTAQRNKTCSVFDISIKENEQKGYLLFVAYEDGALCVYSFSPDSTKTVPYLHSTGLNIDLIKEFDLKMGDFLSAFDVVVESGDTIAVCGSPHKNLVFLTGTQYPKLDQVPLKRPGVSTISIGPDKKLVAVGGWDNTIQLYSMRSRKLLSTLSHHLKQVQDLLFVEIPTTMGEESYCLLCCASMDTTISAIRVHW